MFQLYTKKQIFTVFVKVVSKMAGFEKPPIENITDSSELYKEYWLSKDNGKDKSDFDDYPIHFGILYSDLTCKKIFFLTASNLIGDDFANSIYPPESASYINKLNQLSITIRVIINKAVFFNVWNILKYSYMEVLKINGNSLNPKGSKPEMSSTQFREVIVSCAEILHEVFLFVPDKPKITRNTMSHFKATEDNYELVEKIILKLIKPYII
jgi:hypothetical protein